MPDPEHEEIEWTGLVRETIGMLWSTRRTTPAGVRARHKVVRHGFAVIFWITTMLVLMVVSIVSVIEGHPLWSVLFRALHGG